MSLLTEGAARTAANITSIRNSSAAQHLPSREKHEPNLHWRWQGAFMCLAMFITSTLGCIFIVFPLTPFLYYNQRLWRRFVNFVIMNWVSLPATKIVVTGDELPNDIAVLLNNTKGSLIISNHRCRFDWLYVWGMLQQNYSQLLNQFKIILKKPLKLIPGIGWSMQSANYIFVERKWELDKQILSNALDYAVHDQHPLTLMLFPEGTDFAPGGIERSRAYAEKMKLDSYRYCLHPRTTGFVFILESMLQRNMLEYVYDLTIAYPRNVIQNEYDMFRFGTPREVHIHIKRYAVSDILSASREDAVSASNAVSDWLTQLWKRKEAFLDDFYSSGRSRFDSVDNSSIVMKTHPNCYRDFRLYFALVMWPALAAVWMCVILSWWSVAVYACIAGAWFTVVGRWCNGIETLEQKLAFSSKHFVRKIYNDN